MLCIRPSRFNNSFIGARQQQGLGQGTVEGGPLRLIEADYVIDLARGPPKNMILALRGSL